ncbi:Cationic 19 kDa outer membrane protein [Thiorhodovibrio winogradskyi]|uniref:Cationic 19 kDa outer membrane protein n=1 Tax=Thiorhodovibrio winogradskyi TaxID=77007 RepID=A0ABZ0SCH9_9GAMM|nr:OmpH family outer membrane protein [Thiorhodovibrio winogradskyi]
MEHLTVRRFGSVLFLVTLIHGVAWAESPYPGNSASLRIAIVDPNRIVEESPQYESARQVLTEELSERETTLLDQQEGIDRLQQRLERDAALMSEDELQRLQNDIRSRTRRLRYEKEELQADFALRKNELRTRLVKQVEEVVAQIAREKGIDLILTDGVVYFSERMDVSADIIERLKREFADR